MTAAFRPRLSFAQPAMFDGPVGSDVAPSPDVAPLNVRAPAARSSVTVLERPARGHGFQLDGGSLQAEDALLEQIAGLSGETIGRRDALKVPAVLRGRNVIAGVIATLPIELRNKARELDDRTWLGEQPSPNIEPTVQYALTLEDLLFYSVSYWRVTRFMDGFPVEAEHVDHRSVSQHAILGLPSQLISEDLQFGPKDPIFIDGESVPAREVIRFTSPNPPLLTHAARAIRTALLLEEAARRMANEPMPLGYFTDREDADPLDDEEINKVLSKWEDARRRRVWGYVSQGLELNKLEWPSPGELQLVEERQHAVLEIARAFGLDPEEVGVSVSSRTYLNAEQRRLDLIDFVLAVYISAVEDRLSMPDVTPRGLRAHFDVSAFLRADFATRMTGYKTGIDAGVLLPNEARRKERWPDLAPADQAAAEDRVDRAARGGRRLEAVT